MHAVVALALPAVEAFDLAIPAQVFADPGLPRRYEFTVCAPAAGLVRSTAGFSVQAEHGLDALAAADTVVVPGYLPLGDPGERVCSALRQAAARGARMVSVCRVPSPWPRRDCSIIAGPPRTGSTPASSPPGTRR
jgi:transcriptional regulator GlxA family with amidase domain